MFLSTQRSAFDVDSYSPCARLRRAASRYTSSSVRMPMTVVFGWDAPPVRSKSRVRTEPKRYFADPSSFAMADGRASK